MTYLHLPAPTNEVYEWQAAAACRGMDLSTFFHPWGERGADRDQRAGRAKMICARCPVIDACRTHALSAQEPYGVWGGLTEEERLRLLGRHRRRLPADTGERPSRPTRLTEPAPI